MGKAHFSDALRVNTRFATLCLAAVCLALACLALSGCGPVGNKDMSLSVVYAATALLALLLLAIHCLIIHKGTPWLLLMSLAILVVNLGYLSLALSVDLEEALLANRVAYLGSVFLPMSMLMSILDITKTKHPRILPALLVILASFVFAVAASPGYSDIYYAEVTLATVNGISVLEKAYGPWHSLYLFYLLGYFLAMILVIARAVAKQRTHSSMYATCLAGAVGVNIGVWFIEQLVHINFEMLSISYIISELFLLALSLAMQSAREPQMQFANDLAVEAGAPGTMLSSTSELASNALTSQTNESLSRASTPLENPRPDDDATTPGPSSDCSGAEASDDESAARDLSDKRPVIIPICTDDERTIFLEGLSTLTKTERAIYDLYLDGRSTQEVLDHLEITSNTLKFHNKNLYSKLGVSSRKRLVAMARHLQ